MTTFRPLDPVPGEVTVQNDGNVPTSYAVEVAIGRSLPQGFQTENSRLVFTEALEPGESAQVPVPVTIPSQAVAGPKTVRVRLGTPSILGTIQRVLGQEFFSNCLNVTIPEELPLPGPPPPEGLDPGDVTLRNPPPVRRKWSRATGFPSAHPCRWPACPGCPTPWCGCRWT